MNPNFLDFEQPIADLQAKIEELRLVGNDNALNIGDEIARLQDKSSALTESIFGNPHSWWRNLVFICWRTSSNFWTECISKRNYIHIP